MTGCEVCAGMGGLHMAWPPLQVVLLTLAPCCSASAMGRSAVVDTRTNGHGWCRCLQPARCLSKMETTDGWRGTDTGVLLPQMAWYGGKEKGGETTGHAGEP
jgi:hypothetical protein